jgi:pilus assembly protein Flp/PilA
MVAWRTLLIRFRNDQSGATAIEYGLVVSFVFLVVVGAMKATGASVGDLYNAALGVIIAALS